MRNAFFKTVVFILTMAAIVSCSHKEIFFEYRSFVNAKWKSDDAAVFNVKPEDRSRSYDVTIELRNNDDYAFSNIWLFVDYIMPNGQSRTDTIGVDLADIYGKWYGKGVSLHSLTIPYETSVLYPDSGVYVYSIRQGMRQDPLKGVTDIGLKVSKKTTDSTPLYP